MYSNIITDTFSIQYIVFHHQKVMDILFVGTWRMDYVCEANSFVFHLMLVQKVDSHLVNGLSAETEEQSK
jgi:hypothetical protein